MTKEKKYDPTITVYISPDRKKKIKDYALIGKITPNKLLKNIIETSMEELTVQKYIGLIHFHILYHEAKTKLLEGIKLVKNKDLPVDETEKIRPSSISVNDKTAKNLDKYAKMFKKNRNDFILYIIDMSLREIQILKSSGVLQTASFIVNVNDGIRKKWKKHFERTEKEIERFSKSEEIIISEKGDEE